MKHFSKLVLLIVACSLLFESCKKDNETELESSVLFSVDLDNQKFNTDYSISYLAAYTPEGELLSFGNLSDSSKWDLVADYNYDKIDILYLELWNESLLTVNHIKNVTVGQVFKDTDLNEPYIDNSINITLKVEDCGNRDGNSTASNNFESRPHKHHRGIVYPYGEFNWDKINDGYTYKSSYLLLNPSLQGIALTLFERGTNEPMVSYIDIPEANVNPEDTIILHKNDFVHAELNTIQINSSSDFRNIFLYTYNSIDGKEDLITSFEDVHQDSEKIIHYINSDILPISYWDYRYFTNSATSYTILSNKVMPSIIDVNELTGMSINKSGNQYNFTHGNIFPDKNIARSIVQLSKSNTEATYAYSMFFNENGSVGNTVITPFEIPVEILNNIDVFNELMKIEWQEFIYDQIYTEIPENSPLDFLRYTLLNHKSNNSSDQDYSFEKYSIEL